jgi:hypothetical protein
VKETRELPKNAFTREEKDKTQKKQKERKIKRRHLTVTKDGNSQTMKGMKKNFNSRKVSYWKGKDVKSSDKLELKCFNYETVGTN